MINLVRFLFIAVFLFSTPAFASDVRALAERLEAQAMGGDSRAAYKLGLLFSQGKKIEPDYFTAVEWYERSAKAGYTKAMLKLADIFHEGKGGNLDLEKAKYWNEQAAKKGSRKAMSKLGLLFAAEGNFKESAYWYEKSAVKGDAVSMRELGRYYLEGKGVRFDLKYAFAWLELAIEKGDYKAKSLQNGIIGNKGQNWADDLRRGVNNRMIPTAYWDER